MATTMTRNHALMMLRVLAVGAAVLGLLALTAGGAYAQTPNLAIQQTAPTEYNADGTLTFTISVTNTGDAAANDVFVRSRLDANLDFHSSSPVPATSSTEANGEKLITWNVPTIAPGATYTTTLNVRLASTATSGTVVRNTVTADATGAATESSLATVLIGGDVGIPAPTPTPAPDPTPTPEFFAPGVVGGAADDDPEELPVTGVEPGFMAFALLSAAATLRWLYRPVTRKA